MFGVLGSGFRALLSPTASNSWGGGVEGREFLVDGSG